MCQIYSLRQCQCNTLTSLTETGYKAEYVKGVYLTFQLPCSDFPSKILKIFTTLKNLTIFFGSDFLFIYCWMPDQFIWYHYREFRLKLIIFW